MTVSLHINGSHDPLRTNFVTWAPSPCEVRLDNFAGVEGPVPVILRNQRPDVGGQVVFYTRPGDAGSDTAEVTLPPDGTGVQLQIGGKFRRASEEPGDTVVEVVRSADSVVLASVPLMVRVRKNANDLTPRERNRFLGALGQLNDQGLGRFLEFRTMHNANVEDEAHGFSGFLPWHRAYLLDLERELQAIDSSVSLPYWRFDEAAPRLFTPEFIGVSTASGTVNFSPGHALTFWRTDGVTGISRRPLFDTATERANSPPWGEAIVDENTVLRNRPNFQDFARPRAVLERNPHGYAHTSFVGYVDTPETAPRDPLFFLLHANIDRLWAKWQWLEGRFDVGVGAAAYVASPRIGHRLPDTMWPWNGVRVPPRPTTPAPGGGFAASPIVPVPGQQPRVTDMFDYQGIVAASNRLDFDYDDVPWQPPPSAPPP